MEQSVLRMLDSMIATTKDVETVTRLEQHRRETERHEQLMRGRLEALGQGPSLTSTATAIGGAVLKGVGDAMRADKPSKNARDGYITEHTEIAAYELLERLAERAGNRETAQAAREIRRDEEEMDRWIAERWDKFLDLTLVEAGLQSPGGSPV
jgi:ferritin-like metal-binding protein YciE